MNSDTLIHVWEQSFAVDYKGVYSGVIWIRDTPTPRDWEVVAGAMKRAYEAGCFGIKESLKKLLD